VYKINKEKCTGCQVCLKTCPGATIITSEGKATVVDQDKLKRCKGENVCPFRAIEKTDKTEKSTKKVFPQSTSPVSLSPTFPLPEKERSGRKQGLEQGRKKRHRYGRRS
jgi:MinD superfamily P-loop ATPase